MGKVSMRSSTSPCLGRSTTPDMWEGVIDCIEGAQTIPDMWEGVIDCIEGAQTIAISGHTNPDGDALGSLLGLGASIRAQFPEKRVDFLLADDGPIPRVYRFLPFAGDLEPAVIHTEVYDLFISVDVPTLERLEDSAAVAKRALGRVVIDHLWSRLLSTRRSTTCSSPWMSPRLNAWRTPPRWPSARSAAW